MGMGKFDDGADFLRQVELRSIISVDSPPSWTTTRRMAATSRTRSATSIPSHSTGYWAAALMTQPETEANPVSRADASPGVLRGDPRTRAALHHIGHRHYLNLFIGLIGISGWSRKGTAGDVARTIWRQIDPAFCDENVPMGSTAGPGCSIN